MLLSICSRSLIIERNAGLASIVSAVRYKTDVSKARDGDAMPLGEFVILPELKSAEPKKSVASVSRKGPNSTIE